MIIVKTILKTLIFKIFKVLNNRSFKNNYSLNIEYTNDNRLIGCGEHELEPSLPKGRA